MKCKWIICGILLLALFSLAAVAGGDNSTIYTPPVINESVKNISPDKMTALEDGHFNTSFSDGYNGYCLEYGEHEASKGDEYYVVDTNHAVNNHNKEDVSNYLKVYFTIYNKEAMKDKVVTQHMIWHFTDNFNGWRVNQTLVDMIKETSKTVKIPDTYLEKINDTHERVFMFKVLLSEYEHYQNYFVYKILIREIQNDTATNTTNDTTIQNTINKTNTAITKPPNKETKEEINQLEIIDHKETIMDRYATGNPLWILLSSIFTIFLIRREIL